MPHEDNLTLRLEGVSSEDMVEELLKRICGCRYDDNLPVGMDETPRRIVNSWNQLFEGYYSKPEDVLKCFEEKGADEMIVVRDVEFYSTCEHHMLPFFGRAHIAYVPDGNKVVGLSKLSRLLDVFARRFQIQERITSQVTEALMEHVKPKGAACVLEAQHLCTCARGVGKQNSVMVTSSLLGVFRDKPEARAEFFSCIGRGK